MKTEYSISQKEYLKANFLHLKNSNSTILSNIIFGIIGGVIVGFLISSIIYNYPLDKWTAVGGVIGLFIFIILSRFVIFPYTTNKQYKNHKTMQEPIGIEIEPKDNDKDIDGFIITTESSTTLVKWDKIYTWKQNDEFLLIYPAPRLMYIIPKKIKNNGFDVDLLINLLIKNIK